ncbi:MBL fold metallo-hydrolase [Candidatus Magnetaquicoccus inordinatus]|uniref:MBL fold metallo-hydrolase n=1 Tax=Candidatus Magnetaquicoccus inordinatus TaxID=2496818 RepID=UPI00102BA8E1|nr:MBL fold metallo-hydrolase [Candidatus Magnetaquicoccus inordinatus]
MHAVLNHNIDLDKPVQLSRGVYWVGGSSGKGGVPANPYLIIDNEEGVLIDGGSRPDFSTVMRKILQTGIAPEQIRYLVYQHYDPDLCGSIPNLEQIIGHKNLRILSKKENIPFIRHYAVQAEILCIDDLNLQLKLASGRRLLFYPTPYAHSAGSFVTLDETSSILFSSDLCGNVAQPDQWKLFAELPDQCLSCHDFSPPGHNPTCPNPQTCIWSLVHQFHREVMPCNRALHHAVQILASINAIMVAPQHGSIFHTREHIQAVYRLLRSFKDIGIDHILGPA